MSHISLSPGDFHWKPMRTIECSINPSVIKKTMGNQSSVSYKFTSKNAMSWDLHFETSDKIFKEIYGFLESKGFTHNKFSWYWHQTGQMFNVRLTDGIKFNNITDNTSSQVPINQKFTLTFQKIELVA
mgnify:CR=1 FL=1|jgi:phage-related protein